MSRSSVPERLKIGMVGAGFIGQIGHLSNLVQCQRTEVVALAELRPELRQLTQQRYGIARGYSTHQELLADPEVEAVVVVTPRPQLGPVVLDCLRAGKHVLSEKPMAGSVAQAERLLRAAREAGVTYVVGYMKRWDQGVEAALGCLRDLQTDPDTGPITFVRAHCFMGESYCHADGHVTTDEKVEYADTGWPVAPEDFPEQTARDFAFYLNTYSHVTNLLRYLLQDTPRIEHVAFANPLGRLAVLKYPDFFASLETGRLSHRSWDESVEIYFAHGKLTLQLPPALLRNVPAQVEVYRAGATQVVSSHRCDWTWAFRRQAQGFVDDILEGRVSRNSAEDALEDLRLIEAMWRQASFPA